MSLFFEKNEIRKAIKKAERSGVENIMAQDPRRKQSWTSKNQTLPVIKKIPVKGNGISTIERIIGGLRNVTKALYFVF